MVTYENIEGAGFVGIIFKSLLLVWTYFTIHFQVKEFFFKTKNKFWKYRGVKEAYASICLSYLTFFILIFLLVFNIEITDLQFFSLFLLAMLFGGLYLIINRFVMEKEFQRLRRYYEKKKKEFEKEQKEIKNEVKE